MKRTIFLKSALILLCVLCLFATKSRAQDWIISTQISPTLSGPLTVGLPVSFETRVSLSNTANGLTPFSATMTLDLEGMTVGSPSFTVVQGGGSVVNPTNTATFYQCGVSNFRDGDVIVFVYTNTITNTHPTALNRSRIVLGTGVVDPVTSNNLSVAQVFIKPIMVQPTDASICSGAGVGKSLSSDIASSTYLTYSWSTATSSADIHVSPSGTTTIADVITNDGAIAGSANYTVRPVLTVPVYLSSGSISGTSTTLGDPKTFVANVFATSLIDAVNVTGNGVIYSNQTAVLTPSSSVSGASYAWYTSADKTVPITSGVINGVLSVVKPSIGVHTYYVAATGSNGCEGPAFPASVQVNSLPLKISKVLSPNADGNGDEWVIEGAEQYPALNVKVFDRDGSIVFSSVGYSNPWSGNVGGKGLAVSGYVFIVDKEDGSQPETGVLSLFR